MYDAIQAFLEFTNFKEDLMKFPAGEVYAL